jgi:hypothetical protein
MKGVGGGAARIGVSTIGVAFARQEDSEINVQQNQGLIK